MVVKLIGRGNQNNQGKRLTISKLLTNWTRKRWYPEHITKQISIHNEKENSHIFASTENICILLTSLYVSDNACAGVSCANGGSCRLDPDDGSALCCCATGFTGPNCTVSGNISYIKSCTTMKA